MIAKSSSMPSKLSEKFSKIPPRFLYIFGPFLILVLALFRTLPALLLDQPAPFFNSLYLKISQYILWVLIILVCLLCEISLQSHQNSRDWIWCRSFYTGALLVAYVLMVFLAHGWVNEISTSSWNAFYVEPDTKSYIVPLQYQVGSHANLPLIYPGGLLGRRFRYPSQ